MNINGNTVLVEKKLTHHAAVHYPLRDDAFILNDAEKIELISKKYKEIIEILGLDLSDDSIKETPNRVAKMYVNEVFKGLNPNKKPLIKVFKNTYKYNTPLVELNIPFTSFCEHHFLPIQGKANIAYIPDEYVIGLSKIHRLLHYYACRPQVQERLTMQLLYELKKVLKTEDVGVVIQATHGCISCRGVEDLGSSTVTSVFTGAIKKDKKITGVLLAKKS